MVCNWFLRFFFGAAERPRTDLWFNFSVMLTWPKGFIISVSHNLPRLTDIDLNKQHLNPI